MPEDKNHNIGLFFDLDDTLYNEAEFRKEGFWSVAKFVEASFNIPATRFMANLQKIIEKNSLYKENIFDDVLERLDASSTIHVEELVEVYRKHSSSIKLYDDATNLLERLSGHFILGLITDGHIDVQKSKVEALKLPKYFNNNIIYTHSLGPNCSKPSPLPFKKLLKRTEIRSENSYYVGNDPYKDFIGAKQVGMMTIRLLKGRYADVTEKPQYRIDYNVNKLTDIMKIIKNNNIEL